MARNEAIPPSLRPRTGLPATEIQKQTSGPQVPILHIAIVVPDARIQRLIAKHCYVIGPTRQQFRVTVHAVLADAEHKASALDPFMRWALVETGLLKPEEVGFITSAQVELGWEGHEADTA